MSARAPGPARRVARDTWITDPSALLHALAQAERTQRIVEEPIRLAEAPRCAPPPAPPTRIAPPVFRENERMARVSEQGAVVVIIRRRRAA